MKKVVAISLFLLFFIPHDASAARLWSSGAELQSVTAGVEYDTISGSPTIDTTTKRSGAASVRFNTSAATAYAQHQLYAAEGTTEDIYARFYLYVTTMPGGLTTVFQGENTTNGAAVSIRMNSNGTLELWRDAATAAQIGSDSSALSTGQWYRVELGITTDGSGNITNIEGKIDGTSFASGWSGAGIQSPHLFNFGVITSATTDFYMDDIAVNDTSGTSQTSYPGSGQIVHLYPDSAGDNNEWRYQDGTSGDANNYTSVDETTPDENTTFLKRSTQGQPIDDYNVQSSASAGIGASDTITLVQVGTRAGATGNAAQANREIGLRIKGQSSGTVQSVTDIDVSVNGSFITNSDPVPRIYKLTSYTNPQDSAAWETADLDSMQIGMQPDTNSSTEVRVSTVWALVEYVAGGAPPPALTFSGTLYQMDEATAASGKTIRLAVGTSTPGVFQTTTDGAGAWSITASGMTSSFLGERILAWVSGDSAFRSATFTKASSTANNIPKIDLFRNRLTVKHEGFTGTSTTNADLDFYDSANDADIPYSAVAQGGQGGATDFALFPSYELHIAPGSEFAPGGTVTLHGNASTTNPDGDLHLATGLRQDGVATSSILTMGASALTLAGNWLASSTSLFTHSGTVTFTSTSSQQKSIIATSTPFSGLTFDGAGGSWTFGAHTATTSGAFTLTAGTVTAPSSRLSVGGNFSNSGTFTHNSGTTTFYGSVSQSIASAMIGANAFNNVEFRGAGTKSFGTNAASTTHFFVDTSSGTVTLPSSRLTVGGNYANNSAIAHNDGLVYFSSGSAQNLSGTLTGSSAFATTTFIGAGTKTITNNASSTSHFTIDAGATVVAPTLLTIGGNFTNNGVFSANANAGANLYFSSSTAQTISGILSASSALGTTTFDGAATKTLSANASTTGLTVNSGTTLIAPTLLSIAGNYTNNGVFTAGSGTTTVNGTGAQTFSGTMTGASAFTNLDIVNTSATTSFASAASTTNNFWAKAPGSRIAFFAGATTTLQNLMVAGASGNGVYLHSATPSSPWNLHVPGVRSIFYANVKDVNACTASGNISLDATSVDGGNNTCVDFAPPPALHQLHYRWRNDNGSETTATYKKPEDDAATSGVYTGDTIRLRLLLSNAGASGGTALAYQYRLEHASSSCSTWLPVPASGAETTEHWVMANTPNISEGGATSDSTGLTNPGGKSFVSGYIHDSGNETAAHTLTDSEFSEFEFSVKSTSEARANVNYCFRLTNAGLATNFTYDVTPQITLGNTMRGGGSGGGGSLEGSGSGPQREGGGASGSGGGTGEGSGSGTPQEGGGQGGGGGGDLGLLEKLRLAFRLVFY